MKVLYVAEFDPASVCASHVAALRSRPDLQIDARLAVKHSYSYRTNGADWVESHVVFHADGPQKGEKAFWPGSGLEGLVEFAEAADVIVFNPGIGQAYADDAALPVPTEYEDFLVDGKALVWEFKHALPVALFHGSAHTWAHRAAYAEVWCGAGAALAATTLDYAVELRDDEEDDATAYLPPAVFDVFGVALPRQDGDPATAIHAPSNPKGCNTEEFIAFVNRPRMPAKQIRARVVRNATHLATMNLKTQSNIGFDHLRGSFSVNTLENCLVGLAPFARLEPAYYERLRDEGLVENLPWSLTFPTAEELWSAFETVAGDPGRTRRLQATARRWVLQHFNSSVIAERLAKFFRSL